MYKEGRYIVGCVRLVGKENSFETGIDHIPTYPHYYYCQEIRTSTKLESSKVEEWSVRDTGTEAKVRKKSHD